MLSQRGVENCRGVGDGMELKALKKTQWEARKE